MKYYQKIKQFLSRKIKQFLSIDIRDAFYFIGLSMFGYGLFLYKGLWLAFMICGLLLMVTGYLMRDKEKR